MSKGDFAQATSEAACTLFTGHQRSAKPYGSAMSTEIYFGPIREVAFADYDSP